MKITIFYGSIHKTKGNTYVIINEFIEGAKEAGAKVEVVLLAEKEINNCIACVKCWTKTPGKCALKDDMAGLLNKFMQSDLVVMATPVYIYNVTGIMKTFLDRMMPIIDPHLVKMENGDIVHFKKYDKYPKLGVIATGGFPEQKCCEFISQYFNRIAADLYSEVIFEIYKGEAVLLKAADKIGLGSLLDEYKQNIRMAAKEVVENMRISEGTAQKIDQPFIREEVYIEQMNRYWDSRIASYKGK
jgi:multimeric flavodoxin WrbA